MPQLSFQKPAVAALCRHFRSRDTVKFGKRDVHPPVIVSASVSSGKSLMLAECAKAVQQAKLERDAAQGKRHVPVCILVIQRQGLLAAQNSDAAWSIDVKNSVFSAALNRKSTKFRVVYATEGTIARALNQYRFSPWTEEEKTRHADWKAAAGKFHPDLILIDEVHQCPFESPDSQYMKTLLHFYDIKPHMRLAGMTGSPFRGTNSIVGNTAEHLWKEVVSIDPSDPDYPQGAIGNGIISTNFMIDEGWVVPPVFGYPDNEDTHYDFSHLSTETWEYAEAELDAAVSDKELCLAICADFVRKTLTRKGVLIFAATKRHTRQIAAALKLLGVGPEQIGIITENTTQKEQSRILDAARAGLLKFVINVTVLTTGINVSSWDTVIFMRPIAAIVLLIQAIGRILRLLIADGEMGMVDRDALTAEMRKLLIAASGKPDALVLDYANVMSTLGHLYDSPILEQADLAKAKKDQLDLIECPQCLTLNSPHARRCIGGTLQDRCDWFWSFRACPGCGCKNDQAARECRNQECRRLLVDPMAALSGKSYSEGESIPVQSMNIEAGRSGKLIVTFTLSDGRIPQLIFWPHAGKQPVINSKIWGNFVKLLPIDERTKWRISAMKASTIMENIELIPCPVEISARQNGKGLWTCGRMKFAEVAAETENFMEAAV